MNDDFLIEMDLPPPVVELKGRERERAIQIAESISGVSRALDKLEPTAVVVQGDTNSTLAGAIAAHANEIPIVHVEAGLRSWDWAQPEEHNRRLTDHISDLLCAPTESNRVNLLREGIDENRIVVTGNTVVDAVHAALPAAEARGEILRSFRLHPHSYVLATIHRPENTNSPQRLEMILEQLGRFDAPCVIPVHPRTLDRVSAYGLTRLLDRLTVVDPLPYRPFLSLAKEALFVVSDSGGVQEEASVLGVPTIVVRNSTERQEVIGTVAVMSSPECLGNHMSELGTVLSREFVESSSTPFGDGRSGARIAALIAERFIDSD